MTDVELCKRNAAARAIKDEHGWGATAAYCCFDAAVVMSKFKSQEDCEEVSSDRVGAAELAAHREYIPAADCYTYNETTPVLGDERLRAVYQPALDLYPNLVMWIKSGCERQMLEHLFPGLFDIEDMDDAIGRALGTDNANHHNKKSRPASLSLRRVNQHRS